MTKDIVHKYICLLLILILFFQFNGNADAHPGRTDGSGGHTCRTNCPSWGYEYGEYHYHGGGSNSFPSTRSSIFNPRSPDKGTIYTSISSSNWCNYYVTVNWDEPLFADRFSIAISKIPGADPGPLVDTTDTIYSFDNIPPGKWYINIKGGDSNSWSRTISYWNLDLPDPSPHLDASLDGNTLTYDISCLDKVEGPQEFIDHLENNNYNPRGTVQLSNETSSVALKGWDFDGNELNKSLVRLEENTSNVSSASFLNVIFELIKRIFM